MSTTTQTRSPPTFPFLAFPTLISTLLLVIAHGVTLIVLAVESWNLHPAIRCLYPKATSYHAQDLPVTFVSSKGDMLWSFGSVFDKLYVTRPARSATCYSFLHITHTYMNIDLNANMRNLCAAS
jgi:hypothetical protein